MTETKTELETEILEILLKNADKENWYAHTAGEIMKLVTNHYPARLKTETELLNNIKNVKDRMALFEYMNPKINITPLHKWLCSKCGMPQSNYGSLHDKDCPNLKKRKKVKNKL